MPEVALQLAEVDHFQSLIENFESYPDWFWVRRITEELGDDGCKKIAGFIGVSDRAVRQWREDPVRGSGVVSPINRCVEFLKFVTSFDNPRINLIVLHLLKPVFEQMRVEPVSLEALWQLQRATSTLMPGKRPGLEVSMSVTVCSDCGEPLERMELKGGWYCRTCGRK